MKTSLIIVFAISLFTVNFYGQSTIPFRYHISGNVNVKDGTKIALVQDSRGKTNRMVTTIYNNKFEFIGDAPEIEGVRLIYEDDLLDNDGRLMYTSFFLKPNVNIVSENEHIDSYKVINPDRINQEFIDYRKNRRVLFDSIYSTSLNDEEKNSLINKKMISLVFSHKSIVGLAELSILYDNQQITDSVVLSYGKTLSGELKNTGYYKRMLRIINGKTLLSKGKPYIDFEVQDTTGKKYKISSLIKGNNLTVIDFYATWCGACKMLSGDLSKYYDQCHNKGFEVICISSCDRQEDWKKYVRESKPKWNSYWISESDTVCDLYNLGRYPTIYRLSENGIITGTEYTGLHKSIETTFDLEPIESVLRED